MSPDVLAGMWAQAFLPVLGPNHLAVTDKLPDLLSEETTCLWQATLELWTVRLALQSVQVH